MLILLTIFFTYLKMTEDWSKRRFLSVIFTVLSFRKPLLLRVFENNNLFSHGSWQSFWTDECFTSTTYLHGTARAILFQIAAQSRH